MGDRHALRARDDSQYLACHFSYKKLTGPPVFTGIIEGMGCIERLEIKVQGARLCVTSSFSLQSAKRGDSIAVNGCCLTLTKKSGKLFEADLSKETLRVTNLGELKTGSLVNLERPLKLSKYLGGHLVQGHVDGVGKIKKIVSHLKSVEIVISFPKKLRRYLIPKGSVAVDGVSMTVNQLTRSDLALVVIPHTFQATNLKVRRAGDRVNLEVDMVGKYVESLIRYGHFK